MRARAIHLLCELCECCHVSSGVALFPLCALWLAGTTLPTSHSGHLTLCDFVVSFQLLPCEPSDWQSLCASQSGWPQPLDCHRAKVASRCCTVLRMLPNLLATPSPMLPTNLLATLFTNAAQPGGHTVHHRVLNSATHYGPLVANRWPAFCSLMASCMSIRAE